MINQSLSIVQGSRSDILIIGWHQVKASEAADIIFRIKSLGSRKNEGLIKGGMLEMEKDVRLAAERKNKKPG
ncbi:hypothetical protein VH86_01295 [Pantoea sp. BL1]|uniref:hypothetical protein n=1 Tax=Pantoea sp. BL1 TaxID=1628190 RepID=UPI0005F814A0|nr:hypothetical protein [Pantoea sp. BL1]KJV50208.1 hypothetical protein VH86_01295 [Pantoea sp. BL1]